MTDFPTLSYTSSSEIPYNPFVYPFWVEPPHTGNYRERPPPPPPPERLKQIKQHIELAIQTSLMTLCYMSVTCSQFSLTILYTGMEGGNRVA